MQIDFHHAATYVIARSAGMSHRRANIVAYCAQYVDDATNSGKIDFDNGAMYYRISSAHKMLDYRNSKELANHQVWIPFHFLPGNDGREPGVTHRGSFIKRLVCRPNSYVAQDMIRACIKDKDKAYGLHRLGITMHVYADTWAHQGFAGVNHKVNNAKDITGSDEALLKKFKAKIVNYFISEAFPLGHGAVLSNPDRPYLKWSYTNGLGQRIERDNSTDFLEAAEHMCRAIRRYLAGDPDAEVEGLPDIARTKIASMLRHTKGDTGEKRHEKWLKEISAGRFGFDGVALSYVPKGIGSWKYKALATKEATDTSNETFPYKESFLTSDWKKFHDALQAHRFDVLHDILPKYGICAA